MPFSHETKKKTSESIPMFSHHPHIPNPINLFIYVKIYMSNVIVGCGDTEVIVT